MKVPNKGDLMHYKIQAAVREHGSLSGLEYQGCVNGEHIYLVGDEHLVPVQCIEEFECVDD
tara:strand:+ start:3000 stop:3182 length:183 start_codon:yes stop_codon:yes gene_type:complete